VLAAERSESTSGAIARQLRTLPPSAPTAAKRLREHGGEGKFSLLWLSWTPTRSISLDFRVGGDRQSW
jgi:hypothetical protein